MNQMNQMDHKLKKLIQYIKFLYEWNEKYNLIAVSEIKELLINHIIDCLTILEIYRCRNLIIGDVGSGPGLPGIILSILLPDNKFILIEPKSKYFRFLKKVKESLNLNNLTLCKSRIEDMMDIKNIDIILSRAVNDIDFFLKLNNINRSSIVIMYKGKKILDQVSLVKLRGFKILFIKKIKILETYNKNHYIIAVKKIV